MRALAPEDLRPPFGRYSHGLELPAGSRLVLVSGQVPIRADDTIPEDITAQTELCFANIAAILAEAGMGLHDIVQIRAYVTDRADMAAYMAVRNRLVGTPPPVSTLMIVSGFTRPEMKVEVEAMAATLTATLPKETT